MSICSFRHAVGARGKLSYGDENCWGRAVEPTNEIAFKTEGFKNEIGDLRSEALDPNRSLTKRVNGVSSVSGEFAFEQNVTGYEFIARHALGDYVSVASADGAIGSRVTTEYAASVNDIIVADNSVFVAGTGAGAGNHYFLAAIYKDSSGKLKSEISIAQYTLHTDGVTINGASSLFTVKVPLGAYIVQTNSDWNNVHTHYIEAARDLPEGLTFEVGRDVAYFVYTGMKVNTLEYTFNAQEICQGTASLVGKGEYSGGLLNTATTELSASVVIDTFGMDIYVAGQQVSAAIANAANDETAAANSDTPNDVNLLAASTSTNDTYEFGLASKLSCVTVQNLTLGAETDLNLVWEYYNGTAWVALNVTQDEIGDTFVAGSVAGSVGEKTTTWDVPNDMATTTVAALGPFYYVRMRVDGVVVAGTAAVTADRVWVGPSAIGFPREGGILQVGSENGVAFSSYTIDYDTALATFIVDPVEWNRGSAHELAEPVVSQQTWGHNVALPTDTDPLSSYQAAAYMNGVYQEVLSATVTLNNNLNTDKFQIGARFRAGVPEGMRSVECTLNAEFDDLILYRKYIDHNGFELEIRAVQDSEPINTAILVDPVYASKTLFMPKVELTGTTPNIGGPDQILIDHPGVCMRDTVRDINELVVIFVNESPSV